MSVKLLTEHHLEFLSLKGGCTTSPESTLVKMPHCWKCYVTAQIFKIVFNEMHQEPDLTMPRVTLVHNLKKNGRCCLWVTEKKI